MPAARPHLVAEAQRVVEPVPPPRPRRRLAAGDVLSLHPPAPDLVWLARVGHVVDDEDVADIARHLGRDVGVTFVHVEAVHADAAGLLIVDRLGLRGVGDVVDLEAAGVVAALLERLERAQIVRGHAHLGGDFVPRRIAPERFGQRAPRRRQLLGAAPDLAHVALVIDDQDIAGDARLVAVGVVIVERDGGDHARLAWIGDVDDRGAEVIRVRDVPDIGVGADDRDLAGAGKIEMAQAADVTGELSYWTVRSWSLSA